jgi:hypothetical protein
MKPICTTLFVIVLLTAMPVAAVSGKNAGINSTHIVAPDSIGEGRIETITADGILIKDTLVTLSDSSILQSEDGEHLFESSLKVGDVVLYHVNFRLEIVLLTVIKEK